jgi:hypothetical protein
MTEFEDWIELLPIDNIVAIRDRATKNFYPIVRIWGDRLYYEVDGQETFIIWNSDATKRWQGLKKKLK